MWHTLLVSYLFWVKPIRLKFHLKWDLSRLSKCRIATSSHTLQSYPTRYTKSHQASLWWVLWVLQCKHCSEKVGPILQPECHHSPATDRKQPEPFRKPRVMSWATGLQKCPLRESRRGRHGGWTMQPGSRRGGIEAFPCLKVNVG